MPGPEYEIKATLPRPNLSNSARISNLRANYRKAH